MSNASIRPNNTTSSLPIARPWTPPDFDLQDEYYNEPLDTSFPSTASAEAPFTSTSNLHYNAHRPTAPSRSKTLPIDTISRPYTPTPSTTLGPRYPYTPDSAHSLQNSLISTYSHPPFDPLPPVSWGDSSTASHPSPVQSALFSCFSNLEQLIQISQPNDAQLEYIISQFEAVSSYLAAPEAQSRQTDDHLFDFELGLPGVPRGLVADEYVHEVQKFIEGVKRSSKALQDRFDEVRMLNEIQLEIIKDLRRELRTRDKKGRRKKSMVKAPQEEKAMPPERRPTPQRYTFFAALGDALDAFGALFFHYDDDC